MRAGLVGLPSRVTCCESKILKLVLMLPTMLVSHKGQGKANAKLTMTATPSLRHGALEDYNRAASIYNVTTHIDKSQPPLKLLSNQAYTDTFYTASEATSSSFMVCVLFWAKSGLNGGCSPNLTEMYSKSANKDHFVECAH